MMLDLLYDEYVRNVCEMREEAFPVKRVLWVLVQTFLLNKCLQNRVYVIIVKKKSKEGEPYDVSLYDT